MLLGGFETLVLQWSENHAIDLYEIDAAATSDNGVSTLLLVMVAYDYDIYDPANPGAGGIDQQILSLDVSQLDGEEDTTFVFGDTGIGISSTNGSTSSSGTCSLCLIALFGVSLGSLMLSVYVIHT